MSETVKQLVEWMKATPDLLGWDFIAAVELAELDAGLAHAHLLRWRDGLDIGAVEGSFQIGTMPVFHYLGGLRLGAAQVGLNFSNPNRPVIQWNMSVEGGIRTIVEAPRKVRSVSRFDLLSAARLQGRTALLEDQGELVMDVSATEENRFDSSLGELEQLEGGRFFENLIKAAAEEEPARARYVIAGSRAVEGNRFLATQRIVPSTWANADGQRIALLLLIALAHGTSGRLPVPGGDLPFPLPTDMGDAATGTLLINLEGVQRAAFAFAVEQLLEGGKFDYQQQAAGKLLMKATAGTLRVPPADYRSLAFNFESRAFELSSRDLTVDFAKAEPLLQWRGESTLTFTYWPSASADRRTCTATFAHDLAYTFELFHDQSHASVTRARFLSPLRDAAEVNVLSGLPADIGADERAQVHAFLAYAITRGIYQAFARTLSSRTPDQFMAGFALADVMHFATAQARLEAPNNLALFAPLSSQVRAFSIKEQDVLLIPRQQQRFTLDTEVADVEWSVVALPGSSGEWGSIDATGMYTAPSANRMGPLETRVLVVATDPASNAQSIAKLTVLTGAVRINPLIHVTHPGDDAGGQVPLNAAGVGGGELNWQLLGDDVGAGRLDPAATGSDNTYTPPAAPVDGVTFSVDEVVVSNAAGDSASSLIVVEHIAPVLQVVISADQPPEFGVQLQAQVNGSPIQGVTWAKHPSSPGEVDEQGLYAPDPYATQRFALLTATSASPWGTVHGYIILPLPLEENPGVRACLTASPVNGHQPS